MRRLLGIMVEGSLIKVSVERNMSTIELINKAEIEMACYNKNRKIFYQIQNIPVMRGQLINELGFLENLVTGK